MWCVRLHIRKVRLGRLLSPEFEAKWVNEVGFLRRKLGLVFSVLAVLFTPPFLPALYPQLPHMPHISECLMKRSLKPTDLRDMTIGQLQVIVNDLHSQIESKCKMCLKIEY